MSPASKVIWLTSVNDSHGSWANSIRDHQTELLLRLCRMYDMLCSDSIFLLPVSAFSSFPVRTHPHNKSLTRGNLSETKQKTLEEIAASFGDKLILVDDLQRDADGLKVDKGIMPGAREIETA